MSRLINNIAIAALTPVQAAIINNARSGSTDDERKQIKREVFAVAKAKFGIPSDVKVMSPTTNPNSDQYLVLHAAGKRNLNRGCAFRLDADGKWDGSYVTKDQLFPPPAAPADSAPVPQGSNSVFGGAAVARWFRLDPVVVAQALTSDLDFDESALNPGDEDPVDLPTPHLFLHGRTDLAITADGSIYRKQ